MRTTLSSDTKVVIYFCPTSCESIIRGQDKSSLWSPGWARAKYPTLADLGQKYSHTSTIASTFQPKARLPVAVGPCLPCSSSRTAVQLPLTRLQGGCLL